MKKIYTLLAIGCIGFSSFVQSQNAQPAGTLAPPSYSKCTPTLLQTGGKADQNVFGKDATTPYTQVVQMFEMPKNTTYTIVGVVVWVGYLQVNGNPGTISFEVVDFNGWVGANRGSWPTANQYCPDAVLGNPTVRSVSTLKTSSCLDDAANVVMFDTPVTVKYSDTYLGKFGIAINYLNIGDDIFGVYSTGINEGAMNSDNTYKELAWNYLGNALNGTNKWETILGNTGGSVNADMLVFPIIDKAMFNAGAKTGVCATTTGGGTGGGGTSTSNITITYPKGGETWTAGFKKYIFWNSSGASGNVKLEYSLDSGLTWTTITASASNTGAYSWTVPNTPSTTCIVRVTDLTTSTLTDVSNAVFTIATGGGGTGTGISEESGFFNGMKLSQTYPNPSNDKCLVQYEIENSSKVALSIYDMQGKRVKFFDEGVQAAGMHSINMDVTDLESGNYIYSLSSDGKLLTKRMNLVK